MLKEMFPIFYCLCITSRHVLFCTCIRCLSLILSESDAVVLSICLAVLHGVPEDCGQDETCWTLYINNVPMCVKCTSLDILCDSSEHSGAINNAEYLEYLSFSSRAYY